jgi:hypothetical protein
MHLILPAGPPRATARPARTPREVDEVPDTAPPGVTVHRAEGVLAGQLDVSIDEAIDELARTARTRGVPLVDAARQVLEDHERRVRAAAPPEIGDRALALLRRHLDRAGSPLEGPSR